MRKPGRESIRRLNQAMWSQAKRRFGLKDGEFEPLQSNAARKLHTDVKTWCGGKVDRWQVKAERD